MKMVTNIIQIKISRVKSKILCYYCPPFLIPHFFGLTHCYNINDKIKRIRLYENKLY